MTSEVFFPSNKSTQAQTPVVSVCGLWKSFPGVTALRDVNLDVYAGEIHAILGENGAGKSTLVKTLYGVYVPDKGDITINGVKAVITSPLDAMRRGLVLVSQVPQLIDTLTVAENLALSLRQFSLMSSVKSVEKFLLDKEEEYGIRINPNTEVWKLSYTQKQLVEVLRALLLNATLVAFDEATTLLPSSEKRKLYDFIRLFRLKGGAVLLITHKIPEAMEISDRVTVLRKGEVVGSFKVGEVSIDQIRLMMFGERFTQPSSTGNSERCVEGREAIVIKDLWVRGDYGTYAVKGVSLTVHRGEILGIAGVAGNGQLELVQSLAGLRRVEKGNVILHVKDGNVEVTNKGPAVIRDLGVGYIPDEPIKTGISIDNTIEENLAIHPKLSSFLINWRAVKDLASSLISKYNVTTPSTTARVKILSGGNLMKILIARELMVAKNVLLAYNPTRSLDEVSAHYVRRLIRDKALNEGMSAVVVSEDLDEVMEVGDKIAVINSGRLVGFFRRGVDRGEIERVMVT